MIEEPPPSASEQIEAMLRAERSARSAAGRAVWVFFVPTVTSWCVCLFAATRDRGGLLALLPVPILLSALVPALFSRRLSATPSGFRRRYQLLVLTTQALLAVALLIGLTISPVSGWYWAAAALVVAVPLIVSWAHRGPE